MPQKIQIVFTPRFDQGFARAVRAGKIEPGEVFEAAAYFIRGEPLPPEWLDHPLTDNWQGFREFHLSGSSDNLIIYHSHRAEIRFVAIGRHQDLFPHRKRKRKGLPRSEPTFDEMVEKVRGGGEALAARAARLLKRLWHG
ncbi:MAG: type II toxin-antitoxin system YafQ family toxin [Opitutales bacterium]